jgi:predicted  nucleic acid-binding Zn-ribbon protein
MLVAELDVYRLRVKIERLRLQVVRTSKERKMREVRGLAETIRERVKALKAEAANATNEFNSEHDATIASIGKVKSITSELRAARQEVDAQLGDVGSNFPTQEGQTSAKPEKPLSFGKPDVNGVFVTKG